MYCYSRESSKYYTYLVSLIFFARYFGFFFVIFPACHSAQGMFFVCWFSFSCCIIGKRHALECKLLASNCRKHLYTPSA